MTEIVTVYGFGSSFRTFGRARDIDILLVHRSIDRPSCRFAIACKRDIQIHMPNVDVTMLSIAEAETSNFIAKSSARQIGLVTSDSREAQIQELLKNISELVNGCKGLYLAPQK